MLESYLSRNNRRNQKLLSFCDSHGISYSSKEVSNLSREDLLGLFTKSSDCFTLLSPSLQRFKGHREMKLSEKGKRSKRLRQNTLYLSLES